MSIVNQGFGVSASLTVPGATVMFERLNLRVGSGTERLAAKIQSGGSIASVSVNSNRVVVVVREDD